VKDNQLQKEVLKNIKAIIFDMDGLLVDSEPHWQQAEMEVFKRVGVELSLEDCIKTTGLPTRDVLHYWFEQSPWKGKSIPEVEHELFDEISRLLKLHAVAMPGVYETIKMAKEKGLKIGLASASPLFLIEIVLEKLDLRHEFDFYHSATLEKNNKPHPDVYLTVARHLHIPISECLILEDSYNGIKGGKASGARVVAVPDAHVYDDPKFDLADFKIRSLTELTD
jgi:HAD superfamily hydrolase (TIGR01509 family)